MGTSCKKLIDSVAETAAKKKFKNLCQPMWRLWPIGRPLAKYVSTNFLATDHRGDLLQKVFTANTTTTSPRGIP